MPDEQIDAGDAFRRLKESLGSLMLCWCRLEDAVNASFRSAAIEKTMNIGNSLGEKLTALESRLLGKASADDFRTREIRELFNRVDDIRRRRNLIVHCLSGVSADPAKGEPHILCVQGSADKMKSTKITQTELIELCDGIERSRRDIELVDFSTRAPSNERTGRPLSGR